ncbi:hypothetical protein GY21_04685 [Cryobacterium roopkundense]|uniref:DUF4349 domain-containing protein n=1 Tax=Cryobacterium roopkundense TaxID=1001240 RepID=A0A099JNB6_9MICO|nr:DUF4349 domain-containing protein [Cryobacterium roopkundense]KGJ79631.1 hypothetical protein GY21_04685 [Cryobacterium roopkundense]MBB5639788.1 hypothetical protein [Cryobacterium roopkundense]
MNRLRGRTPATLAAVVLTCLLLAGCTMGSGGAASSTDSQGVPTGVTEPGAGDRSADFSVDGTTTEVNTANRDVVTTGSVSITAVDPITTAQEAATITERANGRVDSRNETPATDTQAASASLTLRIPSDELDRTLGELKGLGTVNFVSLNATDVTQQSQDLDARITALQTSVDRLLSLMSTATTTTDLIAIEGALSTRQAELEALRSQRDYLADQIDFSTITLEIYEDGTVAPGAPDDFWAGLVAGWNALLATLGGIVVAIGVAVPWIGAIAVLGLGVLLIVRLFTRRRKGHVNSGSDRVSS